MGAEIGQTGAVCKGRTGFTLVELLISLTILSIILVIILGAFRVGVRAWEKGEQDIDSNQRSRIVLGLIKQQLSSIVLKKITIDSQSFFLKGDAKSLEFLSMLSLDPGNEFGSVYVKYVVKEKEDQKESLVFFERNIVFMDKEFNPENLDDNDFHALIPDAQDVSFEYLKPPGEENAYEWQETWNPKNDSGVPPAVKMILKKDEKTAPITVIVRIIPKENS